MFDIVLYEPEIPPNTGNIMRLSANAGCRLHLIKPLGFDLDERRLRRAGLDYRDFADVRVHPDLDHFMRSRSPEGRVFTVSTRATTRYTDMQFRAGDAFLFGPETRGLPENILSSVPPAQRLRLPMQAESRSLNLSNAVAILVYEAWRQCGFAGGR